MQVELQNRAVFPQKWKPKKHKTNNYNIILNNDFCAYYRNVYTFFNDSLMNYFHILMKNVLNKIQIGKLYLRLTWLLPSKVRIQQV